MQNFYQLFDIITAIFPVTWQCLRCCVETRDLRYVIIFRSKKVNTDGVLSLNVLTARRLQDNKLKLKTVQSTGKCWQWLRHREYCIIYTLNDLIFSFLSVRCFCFVLEQTCRPFVYCIEMALKHLLFDSVWDRRPHGQIDGFYKVFVLFKILTCSLD